MKEPFRESGTFIFRAMKDASSTDKEELLRHIDGPDEKLFIRADDVRKSHCGDVVQIRGIIEFSNYCCRNCLYCGLRRDNKDLARYRMTEDDIVGCAHAVISRGLKTIVLQSGDDFYYTREAVCRIIGRIRQDHDVAVTLSIGERPFDDYRAFKDAGADRYLLKFETSHRDLYATLHPGQSLAERLRHINWLRELDYQVGTGNIVGLPGQATEHIAEDLLLLQEFQPEMSSIGHFLPQSDTPLAGCHPGDPGTTTRVLALARMVAPDSHIPVTTALVSADPDHGLVRGLRCGANVIMPDFSPQAMRTAYRIYDNKAHITLEKALASLESAGRVMAGGRGDALRFGSTVGKTFS